LVSKPGFVSRFPALCCGQVHGAEQHRPPQMALPHSSEVAHTTPRAFFGTQLVPEQKLVLVQSAEVAQVVLHEEVPQV
jgi:hypothetical protein